MEIEWCSEIVSQQHLENQNKDDDSFGFDLGMVGFIHSSAYELGQLKRDS